MGNIDEVIGIHFDPKKGSPYWLEKGDELDFDPRKISSYEELHNLPEVDEKDLINRPIEDFIPQYIPKKEYTVGESSGTTGKKKQIPWHEEITDEIVEFYCKNMDLNNISEGENWMSIGPYGLYEEHMKKTANKRDGLFYPVCIETRDLKNKMSDAKEFMENKWKLWKLPGALNFKNFMEPTLQTTEEKLETENIGVITSAPQILDILSEKGYTDFEGVLVSGTGFDKEAYKDLDEKFEDAEIVPMYATSFFGPAFDHPENDSYVPEYFASPKRVRLDVVDHETKEPLNEGQRGQVKYDIVEPFFLWPNHYERDSAIKIKGKEPYEWNGVKDVKPLSEIV